MGDGTHFWYTRYVSLVQARQFFSFEPVGPPQRFALHTRRFLKGQFQTVLGHVRKIVPDSDPRSQDSARLGSEKNAYCTDPGSPGLGTEDIYNGLIRTRTVHVHDTVATRKTRIWTPKK